MTQPSHNESDTDQLIWEYLDGGISDAGAEALSSALTDRPEVRERFVDSAMLHGMLVEHYCGAKSLAPAEPQSDANYVVRPRRRKHGRPPAA